MSVGRNDNDKKRDMSEMIKKMVSSSWFRLILFALIAAIFGGFLILLIPVIMKNLQLA